MKPAQNRARLMSRSGQKRREVRDARALLLMFEMAPSRVNRANR